MTVEKGEQYFEHSYIFTDLPFNDLYGSGEATKQVNGDADVNT